MNHNLENQTKTPTFYALFLNEKAAREALKTNDIERAKEHAAFITKIATTTPCPKAKLEAQKTVADLGFEIAAATIHPHIKYLLDIGKPNQVTGSH